jgi:NADPH:quinone reductase-like Zn-dependent oxidoreductase
MRAVVIEEHGGPERLRIVERPDPEPGPGQVRVRIRAAALNHLDLWVRHGIPGVRYPLPLVPGCDGAGLVDALGPGVAGLEPGRACVLAPAVACGRCEACARGEDHFCRDYGILGEHRDGTCADFIVVPARNVLPKPENLSFEEAAAMPLVFLTAWHMLVERAKLRPGETVLIHAAGSGVSTAGIQIAELLGARILVTAGSREKLDRALELGAEEGINYREQDVSAEVRRLTDKRGVDVVFDHVGRDTWDANIRSLARGGRLVFCGNTSGPLAETSLPHVFFKGLSLLGSTMGSLGEVHEILSLAERGDLAPVVDRVLPMTQVAEGHRVLEDREAFGKVVLTPW